LTVRRTRCIPSTMIARTVLVANVFFFSSRRCVGWVSCIRNSDCLGYPVDAYGTKIAVQNGLCLSKARAETPKAFTEGDAFVGDILEDDFGHVNRDLAERIWNWEQQRRQELDLPKIEYSVREGLRLVDCLVHEVLRTRSEAVTRSSRVELVQEGLVSLLDAMSHYRKEDHTETDFEHTARKQIRKHLIRSLDLDTRPVRLPRAVVVMVRKAKELKRTIIDEKGRQPTWNEVAEELQIARERLHDYLIMAQGGTLSMESTVEINHPHLEDARPAYEDQEEWELSQGMVLDTGRVIRKEEIVEEYQDEMLEYEGNDEAWVRQEQVAGLLQDLIPDTEEPSPDDSALLMMIQHDLSEFLVTTLGEDEVKCIRMAFGLDSGIQISVADTAKSLEKSTDEVRVLLQGGIIKLRESYTRRYIEPYLEDGSDSV
jgi:DNA-directed RNA polymerase sigma subunit (sigma70/sigma32)